MRMNYGCASRMGKASLCLGACLLALLVPAQLLASVTVSPSSLSFGNVGFGTTSKVLNVTVTNNNATALIISAITMSNPEFTETNGCSKPLSSGASCKIHVAFMPSALGTQSGTMKIFDNDPSSPQVVSLSGVGIAFLIAPSNVYFGNQNEFTTSAAKTITLTNYLSSPFNIVSIIASGDYAQTNTCGDSVPGKSSCTASVTFTPLATGGRTGYVTFSDSDLSAIQAVALHGGGVVPASTVSVKPRLGSVTFTQTLQYQAKISGVPSTNVNWFVDGVANGNLSVGTITTCGLYTPPSTTGPHLVTAASIADPTQTATVRVMVTDYAGTFTYHNDLARTGQNLDETVLTAGTVNKTQFGKLFSYSVDGYTYAEPLYVENLNISGQGTHNVVFVATEHDSVYSFDADGLDSSPLWHRSFIDPQHGITTVSTSDIGGCTDLVPEIGITSTPVIDPATNTLYVVAKTKEVVGGVTNFYQRLHALDITTGNEQPNSPVVIQATVQGSGWGNDGNGNIAFQPLIENQRAGLALADGTVYISWSAHCDYFQYHGWVMGYDAATLNQVAVYNDTLNGVQGGIWQAGAAPAVDANGHLYFETGNGTFDGAPDLGDSIVQLSTSGGLALYDYFTPYDENYLNQNDIDLGSGGNMLLPDQPTGPPHLLVGCGKEGTIYLVDRDNMGQFNSSYNNVVQSLVGAVPGTWSMPAFWQNQIYYLAQHDVLKAFRLFDGLLTTAPVSTGPTQFYYPGATPVVSANGTTNGIVWALDTSAYNYSGPSVLHAYDATDVNRELYNSSQAGNRDVASGATKFTVPTVANGKVYVGTKNQLDVYGLLP